MPFCHGHLSDDGCGRAAVTIVQDLEQILGLDAGQWVTQPVVEDQELNPGKGIEKLGVGAVGVGEGGLVQQARGALIANGKVLATSGVGESAGQKGSAHAGGAQDKDIEVRADPFSLGELHLEGKTAVEPTRGRQI